MINTHSVIMWKNEDGSTTLSQRYASGYFEPHPVSDPPRVATVIEPKQSVVSSTYSGTRTAIFIPCYSPTLVVQSSPFRSLSIARYWLALILSKIWCLHTRPLDQTRIPTPPLPDIVM